VTTVCILILALCLFLTEQVGTATLCLLCNALHPTVEVQVYVWYGCFYGALHAPPLHHTGNNYVVLRAPFHSSEFCQWLLMVAEKVQMQYQPSGRYKPVDVLCCIAFLCDFTVKFCVCCICAKVSRWSRVGGTGWVSACICLGPIWPQSNAGSPPHIL